MNLQSKRALVTGGTRGIGQAAVEALVKAGVRVAINSSRSASVEAEVRRLKGDGHVVAAPGDLSTVAGCQGVVDHAVSALGGLDILINNAGVGGAKPIEEVTADDWDTTINLNLRAVYFCTKFAIPALRNAKGCVVNVASILGLGGRGSGLSLYCASKGGVVNLTRDLAIELAPDIRVNLSPGAVDTEMLREVGRIMGHGDVAAGYKLLTQNWPIKRVAHPSEIASLIAYLASDAASFITGSIQVVDGGVTAKVG